MDSFIPSIFVFGNDDSYEHYEFISLCREAGFDGFKSFAQKIDYPDKRTYIGKGKVLEIAEYCREYCQNEKIELSNFVVAFNFELTGLQKKNLEDVLNCVVVDRAFVIFKIFEKNAKTKEAKLQVEIAKLKYLKNQLVNEKASYAQVTSGKGHNKGEGEKKIELNRRIIEETIKNRKNELEEIKLSRKNMRNQRLNSTYPKISIVGYTNVGKSTLLNALLQASLRRTDKNVLARNSLFATLETSTRFVACYPYPAFLITDTVGFVSNLPIELVESFKSTLEEIKESDLIIHVVDLSSPFKNMQIEATNNVLKDLGCENIPTIYLLNKYDLIFENPSFLPKENEMFCSLKDDEDIDQILKFISLNIAKTWDFLKIMFPYDKDFNSFLLDNYVLSFSQKENGYQCAAYINPKTKYKYNYLFE